MKEKKQEIQEMPLVTVVMPAYNAAQLLKEAVNSVRNQTFTKWEMIIINDCSTDDTERLLQEIAAEDARIRFVQNEKNLGAAKTRNRAIDMCDSQYIAFLDSDDVWHPEKLDKQLRRLAETHADLCYTSYALVDETLSSVRPDYVVPQQIDYQSLLKENVIGCSTVLARAEILKEHKFQTDFYHEDYVLWLELLKDGAKAVGQTEVLTYWRYRKNSRSYNKWKSMTYRWGIYRKCLKMSMFKSIVCMSHYIYRGIVKYKHP